jgi:hypothetical protein
VEQGSIRQNAPPAQLYNLKEDPAQKKNIFEAQPEIVKSMQEILNGYRSEMGDNSEIGWIDRH